MLNERSSDHVHQLVLRADRAVQEAIAVGGMDQAEAMLACIVREIMVRQGVACGLARAVTLASDVAMVNLG